MTIAAAAQTAYRESVQTSIQDVAKLLQDSLGQKLVAHMLNVSPDTVGKWAAGETAPRAANEAQLRGIFRIFQLLLTGDSIHTIRAWFVGLNPQLDEISPAVAIKEGNLPEVMIAAKAFLAGG